MKQMHDILTKESSGRGSGPCEWSFLGFMGQQLIALLYRYYISSRFIPNPVIFIPAKEVWDFLVMINGELGLDWGFKRVPNLNGFLLRFDNADNPRPRFLGVSTSKSELEKLQRSIPREHAEDSKLIDIGLASAYQTTRAFRRRLEMASALSRVQGKSSKAKELRRMQAKEGKASSNFNRMLKLIVFC